MDCRNFIVPNEHCVSFPNTEDGNTVIFLLQQSELAVAKLKQNNWIEKNFENMGLGMQIRDRL